MEALALYLWYLLSSRDDSDSDEEAVDLPHVKLPEITVLRKNDDNARAGASRKKVSFAEPLHGNGSHLENAAKSSNLLADHYALVPANGNSDHDYASAPLVCYRRLPTGDLVRTPVAIKSVNKGRQTSLQESENAGPNEKPLSAVVGPAIKSVTPSEKHDPSFDPDKSFEPVHDWSELLEQFGTKSEDGDKLYDELISALSGENKDNIVDAGRDSDSVEIVWEGQLKDDGNESRVPGATVQNVYRELFDKFIEEEIDSAEVVGGRGQPVEQPSNTDHDRNGLQVASLQADATELLGSSAVESGDDIQHSADVDSETDIDLVALCDWALSVCESQERELSRKRSVKEAENSEAASKKRKVVTVEKWGKRGKPIEKLTKKQLIARLAKEMRSTQDPRFVMEDGLFKNNFGVSKEFANFLINALSPHLAPPDPARTRVSRIPDDLKVLTALHFFATGNGNKEIGQVIHMSQPQVSKTLAEVINALISSAPDPDLPGLDSEFNELYGLPGIIGAVDATHIPIKPPSGVGRKCPHKERFENPNVYRNSANYFSINVEIVSSSSNRVLFCHTALPGNSTRSMLWSKSKVREAMIERHESEACDKLIAGSGYNCEPWLLTPCRLTHSSPPETKYNTALGHALQDSVRLTIGLLKGRFKCLGTASGSQVLHYTPDKAAQVVTACCALHNLIMDFGEEMPELAFDELDLAEPSEANEPNWDGLGARNSYILQNFR